MATRAENLPALRAQLAELEAGRTHWLAEQQAKQSLKQTLTQQIKQRTQQLAQLKKPTGQSTDKRRKEELQLLQERALAIVKKNQETATALTKQFKQLSSLKRSSDGASTTQPTKRMPTRLENQPLIIGNTHSPSTAKSIHDCTGLYRKFTTDDDATLTTSLLFRISVRYLLHAGQPIPATLLLEKAQKCTGNSSTLAADDIRRFAQTLGEYHCLGLVNSETEFTSCMDQSKKRIWVPGSQVATKPTLCLDQPALLTTWLMLEKQAVEDGCAGISSLRAIDSAESLEIAVRACYFAASLVGNDPLDVASVDPTQSFAYCLSKVFERPLWQSTASYQFLHEFSGFFLHMDKWFQSRHNDDNLYLRGLSPTIHKVTFMNPTTSFSRPFVIREDSIFKQFRSRTVATNMNTKDKQVDPMRILCFFELNGTCNDENCAYIHQKDFEKATETTTSENDSSDKVIYMFPAPELQLLQNFAERRQLMMKKWPLIGLKSSIEKRASIDSEQKRNVVERGEDMGDGNFVALDGANDSICDDSIKNMGNLRYCDGDQTMVHLSAESLEERVKANTGDVNSWILLAIIQLQLDVTCSDNVSQLSDESFIVHQLLSLWRFLSADSTITLVDDNVLRKSLSTLSRALEHEENAYNEMLWLFHIRLSHALGDMEGELQIAEQAGSFIPRSHRLWLHYLTTSCFESLTTMESMYGRILAYISAQHAATMNDSTDDGITKVSSVSILLTAIIVSLCVKLYRAGKSTRVLEILGSVIDIQPTSLSSNYFDVRLLDQRELASIAMIYAHILLFNEIPPHMAIWALSSVGQPPNVKQFAYTIESLGLVSAREHAQKHEANIPIGQRQQALEVYNFMIGKWNYSKSTHDTGSIVLTNWIILFTASYELDFASGDHPLNVLSEHQWLQIKLFPFAAFTAARVLGEIMGHRNQANEIMLSVVSTVDEEHVSEALYYYFSLHQCRQDQDQGVSGGFVCHKSEWLKLTSRFYEIGGRLEEDAIQICDCTDPEKMCKLLNELVMVWMDRWRLTDGETTMLKIGDVYLLLSVIQLLSLLAGPTEAIESLQPILRSSKLDSIPIEWRNLIWKMRFVLEFIVTFQSQRASSPLAAINYGTEFVTLFSTYIDRMSAEKEQKQHLKTNVSRAVMRYDVQAALQECLSPSRSYSSIQSAQMELFRMVVKAVPRAEVSSLFGKFAQSLGHAPEFWLMFADFASQDWEFRKVRTGLRVCLADRSLTKMHSRILTALVALELRLGQMKALAATLERHIQEDPLVIGSWEVLLGLEILCGDSEPPTSAKRASSIADDIFNLKLSFGVNAYGDGQVADAVNCPTNKNRFQEQNVFEKSSERLSLHQCGLFRVPNTVLLCNQLRILDLSANCLVDLPSGMDLLHKLEVLNLSENSIINFPTVLTKLGALKVLDLSHNNLRVLPRDILVNMVKLEILDVRANCIDELSVLVLSVLKSLRTVKLKDNLLSHDAIKRLEEDLPASSIIELLEDDEPMESAAVTDDSAENGSIEDGELQETIEGHQVEQQVTAPTESQADGVSDVVAEQPSHVIATSENATAGESIDVSDDDDEVEIIGFSRSQAERSGEYNALQPAPFARVDQIAALERMKAYANETGMPLAQVRHCQPQLWKEYMKAHIPTNRYLGRCVMCQTANDGSNQRFNTMVLCRLCLQDAVDSLQPQQQQRNLNASPVTETKEDT